MSKRAYSHQERQTRILTTCKIGLIIDISKCDLIYYHKRLRFAKTWQSLSNAFLSDFFRPLSRSLRKALQYASWWGCCWADLVRPYFGKNAAQVRMLNAEAIVWNTGIYYLVNILRHWDCALSCPIASNKRVWSTTYWPSWVARKSHQPHSNPTWLT